MKLNSRSGCHLGFRRGTLRQRPLHFKDKVPKIKTFIVKNITQKPDTVQVYQTISNPIQIPVFTLIWAAYHIDYHSVRYERNLS